MKQIKKGFTLLEVLVVIGIIGILIGLMSSSYSTAQRKARDAKRSSDLKTIQNCLEQAYSYNSVYSYVTASTNLPASGSNLTSTVSISCGGTNLATSTDPINSGTYVYKVVTHPSAAADTYYITAQLEAATSGSSVAVSNLQ